MVQYRGASTRHEIPKSRRRKDTRRLGERAKAFFGSPDGVVFTAICLPVLGLVLIKMPFSGEMLLLFAWMLKRKSVDLGNRLFDFPYRAPVRAQVRDGSLKDGNIGKGVTYIGNETETKEQIYVADSDLRTHMLVLGTTGSGKTEYLLGLVFNALVQNTGFIYIDGKGDPNLQKEIFRLTRFVGREDHLLVINFITSGRDFVDKQVDKVTNNMNMMGNTSSGMLIELIVSLMDDSGGGGDMWKGRAISFVAALTRPLTYLRDKGFITLSPEKYLEYFELNVLEEMVFEHNGRYGELFDVIVAPLRSYLVTLPGYQRAKLKKQEQKTLEQHGFIVMQLLRIFNDLNFNYGHIFKTNVGDVDFYDVVVNRRLLVVLLPALERAPDSLRMLGKMIVGSIKQMMAGCLGNRVEGVIREIIDSRPTKALFPFYCILDEYGYYAVVGFAVAPAQARSLGFSIIFAAQDFSSLKKSSAEEADATWENTNIRCIGRITSGKKSETWERIEGASGESEQAVQSGFERKMGMVDETFRSQDHVSVETRAKIDYDDLAMQENGEFTFLVGKKEQGGKSGGVRVIRGMGFYTASRTPKSMRINDFLPVELPEPADLPGSRRSLEALVKTLRDGSFPNLIRSATKGDALLANMHGLFERNYSNPDRPVLGRLDAAQAVMGWFLSGAKASHPASTTTGESGGTELEPVATVEDVSVQTSTESMGDETSDVGLNSAAINKSILDMARLINTRKEEGYAEAQSAGHADDDDEIVITPSAVTTNLLMTEEDDDGFRSKALPILRQHLYMLDDDVGEDDDAEDMGVADARQMLEMEMVARGKPFSSLEEKWEAEQQISEARASISKETTYILPPEPEPQTLDEMRAVLAKLDAQCKTLNEDAFRTSE